jgi:hypothetical protein
MIKNDNHVKHQEKWASTLQGARKNKRIIQYYHACLPLFGVDVFLKYHGRRYQTIAILAHASIPIRKPVKE